MYSDLYPKIMGSCHSDMALPDTANDNVSMPMPLRIVEGPITIVAYSPHEWILQFTKFGSHTRTTAEIQLPYKMKYKDWEALAHTGNTITYHSPNPTESYRITHRGDHYAVNIYSKEAGETNKVEFYNNWTFPAKNTCQSLSRALERANQAGLLFGQS